MSRRKLHKRMYSVSKDGIGIIAGTLSYSRKEAIRHFLDGSPHDWEMFKQTGYRTVMAKVEVIARANHGAGR